MHFTRTILSLLIVTLLLTACAAKGKQAHRDVAVRDVIQGAQKSVLIQKRGQITSSTYDEEVKLYSYTFIPQDSSQSFTFYYDQVLQYSTDRILDIDVLDNYLVRAIPYESQSEELSETQHVIKHTKHNDKIPPAYEINIDTF
jgi:hypothetical protein